MILSVLILASFKYFISSSKALGLITIPLPKITSLPLKIPEGIKRKANF